MLRSDSRSHSRLHSQALLVALGLPIALAGCGPSYERTGEVTLVDRPELRLSVIQVYEALPLHYYGLKHLLICNSPATTNAPPLHYATLTQGWVQVFSLSGVPGQSPTAEIRQSALAAAVAEARAKLIAGDGWIAWPERVLRVSADACKNFAEFVPWRHIPKEQITPTQRPDFCTAAMDCSHFDFEGERTARYSAIRVDINPDERRHSRISAVVTSSALADGQPRQIVSADGGWTWQVTSLVP